MIAQVLVDVKAKNVNKTYDYLIPEAFRSLIELGARVVVPFGNRKVMGFVLDIVTESEYEKDLKSIYQILDMESYLNQELIDLAKSISEESGSLLIRVLETILPSVLKVIYKPKIKAEDRAKLSVGLNEVFKYQNQVLLENIDANYYEEIAHAIKNSYLTQVYEIKDRSKSLTKRFVTLTEKPLNKITAKQEIIIDYLKLQKHREEMLQILISRTKVSSSVINTLEKNGYLEIYEKEVYRKVENIYPVQDRDIVLNPEQAAVFEKIVSNLNTDQAFLLHGVTGSGKTEIYLKTIEETINQGKNVILLVPEIALTPMMISRFKSRFS
jgi:primosomal protein N' (replication factor Y)